MLRTVGVAFVVLGVCVGAVRAQDRRAEAAKATAEFAATRNFVDGRGLAIVPGLLEALEALDHPPLTPVYRRQIENSFGVNMVDGKPVGLFPIETPKYNLHAFGCVVCHSGKAAGRVYIGLGNKGIDAATIGQTIVSLEKPYRWTHRKMDPEKRDVVDRGFAFARKLALPRLHNLTRGLVSINLVNIWFYEQAGVPMPDSTPRGGTRVPPLWGIEAKATQAGLFYDGLGMKGAVAWLALPELTAGQTADGIRSGYDRIERLWWDITKFLPPEYPFPVDRTRAARGQQLYAQSCEKCHGTYARDTAGLPVFQPPLFSNLEDVGTDSDRIDGNTPLLKALIAKSPLADRIKADDARPRGYFAPRLEGVWANFPYMHNGSVPTLMDLLEKPDHRPRFWSLRDQGELARFDQAKVGLTLPPPSSLDSAKLETFGSRGARDVYDTHREGHSNRGHDFGTDLSGDDKRALVEYLKTL